MVLSKQDLTELIRDLRLHGFTVAVKGADALEALSANIQETDGQLSRILHEMAGAASMCWEPRPEGVFDSSKAIEFVEGALTEIRALLHGTENKDVPDSAGSDTVAQA